MKENSFTDQSQETLAECRKLKELLVTADSVVVGAGAGLSAAAGLTYSGKRFHRYFFDFEEKYGFHDMYAGGFYPYPAAEEFWAFWSRYIWINRYERQERKVYRDLLRLLQGKDYFVITTNVDHQFHLAGFDKERLFYTQGDYGLFQCSVPCRQKTYDNEEAVKKMLEEQRDMKIPTALIPRCPVCGSPMAMNLRCDGTFVEDEGWHAARARYEKFLQEHRNRRILFLELGVGMNTPGIVKYPFWQMTSRNERAFYACVNLSDAYAPPEIRRRSLCISEDIGNVLSELLKDAP